MSDEEFRNKFIIFNNNHKECGETCVHWDLFYKKILVQNTFQRMKKRLTQKKILQIMTSRGGAEAEERILQLAQKIGKSNVLSGNIGLVAKLHHHAETARAKASMDRLTGSNHVHF